MKSLRKKVVSAFQQQQQQSTSHRHHSLAMAEKSLAGKVAIVTGSGKIAGIGAAAAIALAEQGANVGFSKSVINIRYRGY